MTSDRRTYSVWYVKSREIRRVYSNLTKEEAEYRRDRAESYGDPFSGLDGSFVVGNDAAQPFKME